MDIGVQLIPHEFCFDFFAVRASEFVLADIDVFIRRLPFRLECNRIHEIHDLLRLNPTDQLRNHLMRILIDPAVDIVHGCLIERCDVEIRVVIGFCRFEELLRHDQAGFVIPCPDRIGDMQLRAFLRRQICHVVVVIGIERVGVDCLVEHILHLLICFFPCAVCGHAERQRNGKRRDHEVFRVVVFAAFFDFVSVGFAQQIGGKAELSGDKGFIGCFAADRILRDILCQIDGRRGFRRCLRLDAELGAQLCDVLQDLQRILRVQIAVEIDVTLCLALCGDHNVLLCIEARQQNGIGYINLSVTVCIAVLRRFAGDILCGNRHHGTAGKDAECHCGTEMFAN